MHEPLPGYILVAGHAIGYINVLMHARPPKIGMQHNFVHANGLKQRCGTEE
jgi:hypothetical protein